MAQKSCNYTCVYSILIYIDVYSSERDTMARPLGSKNKNSSALPQFATLLTEERILVLANLIVDRILEDQRDDSKLLKKLTRQT